MNNIWLNCDNTPVSQDQCLELTAAEGVFVKEAQMTAGGVSVGIAENGTLREDGYNKLGQKVFAHPVSGITFLGYQLPSYDKAVELVKKTHPRISHYRSVSWDIAIIEDGTPVLIEANLCRGGIDLLQLNNGPLFGDDTQKILDEVFGKTVK